MRKSLLFLTMLTFLGIILYWITVFGGVFEVKDIIPGYRNWFMAFPLADFWIAICSLSAFIFLVKQSKLAVLFGLLAGSGLIFLGLNALLYGINTGLICNLTADEIVEILIKVYCISVGAFFITSFWKLNKNMCSV